MTTTQVHRILFTAFEPSGDALAEPIIRRLLELRSDLEIHAFGGPRMQSAGAELLESTTQRATMGLGALSHIRIHHKRLQTLDQWLAVNDLSVLVAVDSPAANWSICKRIRRAQPNAKILHLAAPQLWAWAPWRIGKLRRLTDQVLCLLPFEPEWFRDRGVPAVFVGHPIFDTTSTSNQPADMTANIPDDDPLKVALLPGSRASEIRANWPTMQRAFALLKTKHPNLCGQVAAGDDHAARLVRSLSASPSDVNLWSDCLSVVTAQTDDVLDWAHVALVVSGTVTLQCAAHTIPMVVLYNVSRATWWLWGKWIVQTDTFALPNLIAVADGREQIIPELVPHFGDPIPVADCVDHLIHHREAREQQRLSLKQINCHFSGQSYRNACVEQLIQAIDHGTD